MEIFKTINDNLVKLDSIEDDAWVTLVNPSKSEIDFIVDKLKIEEQSLRAALDTEERPRIEIEDNETLIVIDVPYIETDKKSKPVKTIYSTMPVGIIITENNILTVSSIDVTLFGFFKTNPFKGFSTAKKTTFLLQMLYKNSANYLVFLRNIEKQSKVLEDEIHGSIRNQELFELLVLEKSLVYFSTSLKSNEIVLERLSRLNLIKKYPDDIDILEDAIIENKQAIEMAKIYSDVLGVVMESFAAIVANNFNTLMKRLTSVTIIMAIPTILSGIWGMNVDVPFASFKFGFWYVIVICVLVSTILAIIFRKNRLL
ncbi:MAG: magnesium transporter CorA family protein [Fusobacteriaceae bacterium]